MSANEIYAGARVEPGNALIDITADGVEYVAEAPRGTAATAAAWVCSAVYPIGAAGRRIKQLTWESKGLLIWFSQDKATQIVIFTPKG